jgi:cytochrome c oxidase accessory protein FixG
VLLIFTAVSLFDFGWFREQFCCYLCPYARFQGAMLDAHSLIVGYDYNRGEPRGKAEAAEGDCVDCTMCAQVCPTGIDIRKGLQLECIACASCVDACDEVMGKLGKPTGLIRYTSLEELQGRKPKFIRPRVVLYALLLTVLTSIFAGLLLTRKAIGVDLVRQAPGGGENFTRNPDGRISNPYRVHIMNRTRQVQEVQLSLEGFPGAELVTPENPYQLQPGEVATLTAIVLHSPEGLRPTQKFTLRAQCGDTVAERATSFLAPSSSQ